MKDFARAAAIGTVSVRVTAAARAGACEPRSVTAATDHPATTVAFLAR